MLTSKMAKLASSSAPTSATLIPNSNYHADNAQAAAWTKPETGPSDAFTKHNSTRKTVLLRLLTTMNISLKVKRLNPVIWFYFSNASGSPSNLKKLGSSNVANMAMILLDLTTIYYFLGLTFPISY
jgi:hypothetical protein